eukprot:scaffold1251_cov333-Pavlova_lutheri.AAC.1
MHGSEPGQGNLKRVAWVFIYEMPFAVHVSFPSRLGLLPGPLFSIVLLVRDSGLVIVRLVCPA